MLSGVKGNNVGDYLKGATEAGATLAKEAIQINDSNKVVNSLYMFFTPIQLARDRSRNSEL